jgi:hypothetical protein
MIAAVIAALVALQAPAPADPPAEWRVPEGTEAVTQPGRRMRVHSPALRRELTLTVYSPGGRAPRVLAIVLGQPVHARRLAGTFAESATIVAISPPERLDDPAFEAWQARTFSSVPYRDTPGEAAAFDRFLFDELIPFLDQHYPAEIRLLFGEGWAGQMALRAVAARPELFEETVVVDPLIPDGAAELIMAQGRQHPEGFAGSVTLFYDRSFVLDGSFTGQPLAMERLIGFLYDHGNHIDAAPAGAHDDPLVPMEAALAEQLRPLPS